jgi:hypothetical protein
MEAMTIQELHNKLIELGVSEDRYYLHGLHGSKNDDDKFSLTIKRGDNSIVFDVYFKEKGQVYSLGRFTEEHEACDYLFKLIKECKEIEDKYSN